MTQPVRPTSLYYYSATVLRWVDADTVKLDVDMGRSIHLFETIRLHGINAYEKKTLIGVQALGYVVSLAPTGSTVYVQTFQDAKEKYGRLLAKVWHDDGDATVNDLLVANGYAVVVDW